MTTRYKRYSINLDDDSHRRFRALADDLSVSMSGLLRMIIKDAFETKPKLAKMNQNRYKLEMHSQCHRTIHYISKVKTK